MLAVDVVTTFDETAKLDTETADKLANIGKQQWDRLAESQRLLRQE